MEELKALPEYLRHELPQVRLQACQLLGGLSSDPTTQEHIQTLNLSKHLRDLITDENPDVSKAAVSVLINLCSREGIRKQLVNYGTIGVCMDSLRAGFKSPRLKLMLISNLTLTEHGCKKLMQVGEPIEGLNFRMLLQWFGQVPDVPYSPSKEDSDPFGYVGNIVSNMAQLPQAQKLMMDRERGILPMLVAQLRSPNPLRQMGVLRAFKNCFMNHEFHQILLAPENKLYGEICALLLGGAKLKDEDRQGMVDFTPYLSPLSGEARVILLDLVHLCLRHQASRRYLQATKMYVIIREFHAREQQRDDPENRAEIEEAVQGVLPFLLLPETEEELAKLQSAPQSQPEQSGEGGEGETTTEEKVTHESSSHGKSSSAPAATAAAATTTTPTSVTATPEQKQPEAPRKPSIFCPGPSCWQTTPCNLHPEETVFEQSERLARAARKRNEERDAAETLRMKQLQEQRQKQQKQQQQQQQQDTSDIAVAATTSNNDHSSEVEAFDPLADGFDPLALDDMGLD